MFYLAGAPRFFGPIVGHRAAAWLVDARTQGFRRIVIEKPFGNDLTSARALNARILRAAGENQVYRIDHFLGKETVQNIMALRLREWYVRADMESRASITSRSRRAETVGVEH